MPEKKAHPPVAKIVPYTFAHLGHTLTDHYAWLQDKSDPEVLAYLESENAYAKAQLQHTEALQEQIFQEMKGRIKEEDSSIPAQHGEYFYYYRMETNKQYRVFCRKHASLDAPEEVLLDENQLAQGLAYCRVGVYKPSPDDRLLAYSVDTTGSFIFNLYIKDLLTGATISGPIPNTAYTADWANDSLTLFYTVFDQSHRSYQLYRHRESSHPQEDTLLFHEEDDSFSLSIRRTRSKAYLLLTIHSHSTSEVHYLPADQPEGTFQLIQPRQPWMEYYVAHHGNRFLIRTNHQAENFKLVETPVAAPSIEHWREVIPHRPEVLLSDLDVFSEHLVVHEWQDGLERARISAPDGITHVYNVNFPDPVYTYMLGENFKFNTPVVRLVYSSLVTPVTTVDYDMAQKTWTVRKQQEIPSGYDPAQYTSERLFAAAPDGERVPISIVYRKDFKKDGSHPLLLEGYGSYGYSNDPDFDSRRLSLLERGFAFAIAHIRGGSELGRAWYEQGRLMHKKNTFTDFIACAEHLVQQGYTSPPRLGILGASAGGLLMGAVVNLRPDLFKAVVALVPFTNVITAMLDPDLPLTVVEYEQWGNPHDPQAFDYMLTYSPYENVQAGSYPHIFAKAGLNDLQVPYWDPAKWVAKLRTYRTGSSRLVFVINMGAGHGGSSGRFDHLREDAQYYAFLVDCLTSSQ
jgi:oligopeptidase B